METPLIQLHKKLNAKIVDFHNWKMPLYYDSIINEHLWTKENASIFDVSHMGRILINGKGSIDFLNYITTIDILNLQIGSAKYGLILNENAGIVDDLVVYRIDELGFLLVVNAGTRNKDLEHIRRHSEEFDIKIEDITFNISQIAIQGPKSKSVLEEVLGISIDIPYYCFVKHDDMIISRTGYTTEDGFEVYINSDRALEFTENLLKNPNIKMAGLGARNTLRLEAGYCLYGNDIDENINPISARLRWTIYLDKNFLGKERLLKIIENGVNYVRVGFIAIDRGIPREKDDIYINEKKVGYVTSGAFSPTLKKGIGMGYMLKEYSKLDTEILINGNKFKVVRLPFVEGSLKNIKK
ncbi:MAG: glycine cleavage system aminomethyltransferase GcvT [candidate division WOR-3 bacterium]|nr:glycine cleavage system aminomethyltransferase GcvT [candidate division WOR-3 bacterium]MCX7947094.1 glycine cleavage system aminomethyltransferase GcvT [candidate division WOR-3 bacterium]MDW8149865.1 glycine cleavage system aminomethyltransferase GcvT [candidate division WOR-3 bacterium]